MLSAATEPTDRPVRKPRVLVAGPYGGWNLGDEFILSEISKHISALGFEPWAMSADRAYTAKVHGLSSVPAYGPRRLNFSPLTLVRDFDALVIGGGEQLSEPRVPNPVWGLLAQACALIMAARFAGVPVFVWGVGVDANISFVGRLLLRLALRSDVKVTVRDQGSADRLAATGIRATIHKTADPVFGAEQVDRVAARARLREVCKVPHSMNGPVVLVCPSNDQLHSLSYLPTLLAAVDLVTSRTGGVALGLLMDRRKEGDLALLDHAKNSATNLTWLETKEFSDFEIRSLFAGVDLVVSTRMHPIIIAATQRTPWLGIARSAKMRSLFLALGVRNLEIESLTVDELVSRMQSLVLKTGRDFVVGLEPALAEHRASATTCLELFTEWAAQVGLFMNPAQVGRTES